MNFNLKPPSLEQRALIKVAIMLCGQDIRRDLMSHLSHKQLNPLSGQKSCENVSQKVTMITLPPLLKEKLFAIIEAVILQKQSWTAFHMRLYDFISDLPIILVWTPHGTIDYKKTAEVLVKDETIELEKRYILACVYCLEDYILDLQGKFGFLTSNASNDVLICFWSHYKKGNEHHFSSVHYNIFSVYRRLFQFLAVESETKVPLRYFFNKLTPEDADNLKFQTAESVAKTIRPNEFVGDQSKDILYFLLTTMNVEQQIVLSVRYTYEVLRCLLVWPRQSLFLEVAEDNFEFLSKNDYWLLLYNIVGIMTYKHSYLGEIFLEFWQRSPKTYKQFVTDRDGIGRLLILLYEREDERSVKMILNDASISAKKNIIFSDAGQDVCKFLVNSEKWDSIEYLIQECISSPQEMTEFKGKFTQNVTELRSGNRFSKDHQWNKFLRFLENFNIIYRKRKVIKDDDVSTKKVCRKNIQK